MAGEAPTDRIRVLLLIKGLGTGGAERIVWWMTRAGDGRHIDYDVAYVVPWADSMVEQVRQTGVMVHCLHGHHSLELGWMRRLRRLLVDGRYDVVHVHSPLVAGVTRLVVRTLPARQRPALVSTEHCTWASYHLGTQILNSSLYRWDDARFASSQQVYRSIWPPMRSGVEVVVHGLMRSDLDVPMNCRDVVRQELGISSDEVVVTTVANFRGQKGYPDLLTAARRVIDRVPNVRFFAVGSGELHNEIAEQHRQLGLDGRFSFLGYRKDVMRILSAADVFALASLYEGGPIAVMESMAAGVPVVATSVGFVPDVITNGVEGWIVSPSRPEELAGRIIELACDPLMRARMGEAALERSGAFDVLPAIRRVEATYRRLAAERGVSRARTQ